VRTSGKSQAAISRDLGIPKCTLVGWDIDTSAAASASVAMREAAGSFVRNTAYGINVFDRLPPEQSPGGPRYPDGYAQGNSVYLYLPLPPPPLGEPQFHTALFKFAVAHELGHTVHTSRYGNPNDSAYSIPNDAPALCRCDHVPHNQQSHCLNSTDGAARGQVEGFAHFFAAKTWNGNIGAGCTFAYYKPFLEANSTISRAPVAKTCSGPVLWYESHCNNVGTENEWDWMNFFRAGDLDPAATRMDVADLTKAYVAACGGTKCFITTSDPRKSYADLLGGVQTVFGPGDQRALAFAVRAFQYGVDQ
jgi:hypothetical protein